MVCFQKRRSRRAVALLLKNRSKKNTKVFVFLFQEWFVSKKEEVGFVSEEELLVSRTASWRIARFFSLKNRSEKRETFVFLFQENKVLFVCFQKKHGSFLKKRTASWRIARFFSLKNRSSSEEPLFFSERFLKQAALLFFEEPLFFCLFQEPLKESKLLFFCFKNGLFPKEEGFVSKEELLVSKEEPLFFSSSLKKRTALLFFSERFFSSKKRAVLQKRTMLVSRTAQRRQQEKKCFKKKKKHQTRRQLFVSRKRRNTKWQVTSNKVLFQEKEETQCLFQEGMFCCSSREDQVLFQEKEETQCLFQEKKGCSFVSRKRRNTKRLFQKTRFCFFVSRKQGFVCLFQEQEETPNVVSC